MNCKINFLKKGLSFMTKSKLLIIFMIAILFSCDSPRSKRSTSFNGHGNSLTNNGNGSGVNLNNNNSPALPTSGSSSIIPTDAGHCSFASDGITGFESNSSHLNEYTLCQSSTDNKTVYFQLKIPPKNGGNDVSICLIPTTSSGANSIYVGNPMCGYFNAPKSVRKITFIKFPQYANANITGVIFFKDLSYYYPVYNKYEMTLEAYKMCMNMLAYGNTSYCQAFKDVGQYVFKQF